MSNDPELLWEVIRRDRKTAEATERHLLERLAALREAVEEITFELRWNSDLSRDQIADMLDKAFE